MRRALNVLIVEDHADTAETLQELLRAVGHRADIASDVASALARLEAAPAPDAILIDLALNGSDGLAVAIAARLGVDAFLVKPITVDQLTSCLG
jgi:CheY-like chemotaxis protein